MDSAIDWIILIKTITIVINQTRNGKAESHEIRTTNKSKQLTGVMPAVIIDALLLVSGDFGVSIKCK